MNAETAKAIIEFSSKSDTDEVQEGFPSFFLRLAAVLAEYAQEWERIGNKSDPISVMRRADICEATYALAHQALYDATQVVSAQNDKENAK